MRNRHRRRLWMQPGCSSVGRLLLRKQRWRRRPPEKPRWRSRPRYQSLWGLRCRDTLSLGAIGACVDRFAARVRHRAVGDGARLARRCHGNLRRPHGRSGPCLHRCGRVDAGPVSRPPCTADGRHRRSNNASRSGATFFRCPARHVIHLLRLVRHIVLLHDGAEVK